METTIALGIYWGFYRDTGKTMDTTIGFRV